MKIYVYIDSAGFIWQKSNEYIEQEDPGFFSRNAHLMLWGGRIDTEDDSSMMGFLRVVKRNAIKVEVLNDFCKAINFDYRALLIRSGVVFPERNF